MFLYKKQKEEFRYMNAEKTSCPIENGPDIVPPTDQEKGAEGTVLDVSKEKDDLFILKVDSDPVIEANVVDEPKKPEVPMNMEVDQAVVKQEEEPELTVEESLGPCKVEEASEFTNEEKNELDGRGGGGGIGDGRGGSSVVLSDVSTTTAVAVMPTESIEFGSVNLNRIHHHSPESTH